MIRAARLSVVALGLSAAAASAQTSPTPATPATAATASATPAAAPTPPPPPAEIEIGRVAPDFTMDWADASGPLAKPVSLSGLRGKVVVLAFYPGDRTSGCTAELTKFRDEYATMFGSNTVVVGVSVDGIASHASWAEEMKLPFALAADTDLAVAKQYGSAHPTRHSTTRTVFVIGKDGRILWRNLKFGALNESAYTELAAEVAKAQ
ncbi:MAG: peroxiredoxin [Gemmatimonadaceae bacterium]